MLTAHESTDGTDVDNVPPRTLARRRLALGISFLGLVCKSKDSWTHMNTGRLCMSQRQICKSSSGWICQRTHDKLDVQSERERDTKRVHWSAYTCSFTYRSSRRLV